MIEPMKAVLADTPFSDPNWIFERKLDGIRCLATRDASGVRLVSRTGRGMNHEYPDDRRGARARAVRRLHRRRRDRGLRERHHELLEASAARPRARARVPLPLRPPAPRRRGPAQPAAAQAQGAPPPGARVRRAGALQPPPQRRARRGAVPRGLREGPRGSDREARRQPLPERRPLARLAQAEVPRRAGARDRRLHRAEGLPHRVRRAARGLLRRRRDAPLRRQGRHRLRPPHAAGARRAHARARAGRVAVRALQADPAGHALGAARAGRADRLHGVDPRRPPAPPALPRAARRQARARGGSGACRREPSRSRTRTSCCSPTTASRRRTSPRTTSAWRTGCCRT